ncbi:MAG: acyl-CoA dehydratase activase-related protein [Clostridia bacterium]|nr:acyl-CoA dehydratase activase-related protein [Clostridia bacterium]MDD4386660.1 acyl-CoA dehydratase activase-related protein [Clostridia bacterium]
MINLKIGIPKAMLYYKYNVLWETFFTELGCEIILSENTNKKILNNGIIYSADESCLASKIYMGHIFSLIGKCDYIFIPRFCSFKNNDIICVKFNAFYDICSNVFDNINILTYDVDYLRGKSEFCGFLDMGKKLGASYMKTLRAYLIAKKKYKKQYKINVNNQNLFLEKSKKEDKLNILVVSHPYIVYDELLGKPIIIYLKKLNANLIYANVVDKKYIKNGWKNFSKTVYWEGSKELLSGLNNYLDSVDGIIFISVFTCGPDSLVNELCTRKLKEKACLNLILDELNSDTGIQTRLESFTDVLNDKKRIVLYG